MLTSIGSMETIIHAANEGVPLRSIAIREHRAPVALISSNANPLTTPTSLVGKTIGIPSAGGTSELTLNALLKKYNIPIEQVKRQVTGFAPGTFELIKQGRIDGFIIGATQMGQFQVLIPEAVFLQFGKYVLDSYGYVTTPDQIRQNRLPMRAYLQAVRHAMFDIIADKKQHNYANTLAMLRAHYDFEELKDDRVANTPELLVETHVQRRAVEALVEVLPDIVHGARSFPELEERAISNLPHIGEVLDLPGTLQLLARQLRLRLGARRPYGIRTRRTRTPRRHQGRYVSPAPSLSDQR